ncbi:uncharacterized protein SCHCODRAFT_02671478 [Schizophyllum commune H4-8]|nr:uncharacterized protein SCHCODRAFT_02671478 [Schizophyllum commune H4-8]KAI5887453.1 hypothetical protein SCHCODRAFT_02671478 [Schizophyllum commune H4-8]
MDGNLLQELDRDFAALLLNGAVSLDAASPTSTLVTATSANAVSPTPAPTALPRTSGSSAATPEKRPSLTQHVKFMDDYFAMGNRDNSMTRKAHARDRKSVCGRCSEDCQRTHWCAGHKADCASFAQPPLAKTFDPSNRSDVPWPVDPIFASANRNGVGVWMSVAGDIAHIMDPPYAPPEGYVSEPLNSGPPSWARWAGLDDPSRLVPGPSLHKYFGGCLANFRFVVQNRRKDGQAMAIIGGDIMLTVNSVLKEGLLPEDLAHVRFERIDEDKVAMHVFPWIDYTGRTRAAIVEINGVAAPKGDFSAEGGEYRPPERPSGKPWDRVLDWDRAEVILAPGDFAIICAQFRLGDAHAFRSYPRVLHTTLGAGIPCIKMGVRDVNRTASELRSDLYSNFTPPLDPDGNVFMLQAGTDIKYIWEYFEPLRGPNPDDFLPKRIGKRATQREESMKRIYPAKSRSAVLDMDPELASALQNEFARLILETHFSSDLSDNASGVPMPEASSSSSRGTRPSTESGATQRGRRKTAAARARAHDNEMWGIYHEPVAGVVADENAARKAHKRDAKENCGRCGKEKAAGTRLQTCSRCKYVIGRVGEELIADIPPSPQVDQSVRKSFNGREHWRHGHKVECTAFVHPPLAKTFDSAQRPDVPWPIDPIFARVKENGLGVWVTASPLMGHTMQPAYVPADGEYTKTIPPPSFLRWIQQETASPMELLTGALKKFSGPTLVTLRIMVQNRRTDGRIFAVFGEQTRFSLACDELKEYVLPEERDRCSYQTLHGIDLMWFPPWQDYNDRTRVALLEINGVEAPRGTVGPDLEYQPPEKPTGAPWNRVVDWKRACVALAPGDFAVYSAQYRIGDGVTLTDLPQALTRAACVGPLTYISRNVTDKEPDWAELVETEVSIIAGWPLPPPGMTPVLAEVDIPYVDKYYEPYYELGPDAFLVQRYGMRAKRLMEDLLKAAPEEVRQASAFYTPPAATSSPLTQAPKQPAASPERSPASSVPVVPSNQPAASSKPPAPSPTPSAALSERSAKLADRVDLQDSSPLILGFPYKSTSPAEETQSDPEADSDVEACEAGSDSENSPDSEGEGDPDSEDNRRGCCIA